MKTLANLFIQDINGNMSSKRLGFLRSLNHWIFMSWVALIWLLVKEKYTEAVDLIQISALTVALFAGAIASEFFAKAKENKKTDLNDTDI